MNDQIEVLCTQLPEWLPILVREHFPAILRQYLEAGEDPAPDIRLATDLRIRGVWRELKKRHRSSSEKFFYTPAWHIGGIEGWPSQEEARIERAMATLFQQAIRWFRQPVVVVSRSEVEKRISHWKSRAVTLREIQEELDQFATSDGRCLSINSKCTGLYDLMAQEARLNIVGSSENILIGLFMASLFCDDLAKFHEEYLIPKAVVERRKMDPKLRAFLVMLTQETKQIFGLPLYGIVATIASVLFKVTVRKSSVRECVANSENLSA